MKAIDTSWTRTWKKELNSEAFISGLEAAIAFTRRYGNESSFGVEYCQEINSFAYPGWISIGTKESVSDYFPLNLAKVNEAYKRQTGLPFPHPENKEWKRRSKKLNEEQRLREMCAGMFSEEVSAIINPSLTLRIVYPSTKDKAKKDRYFFGWAANQLGEQEEAYKKEQLDDLSNQDTTLINVHTHPNGNIAPSSNDLKFLNYLRLGEDSSEKNPDSKLAIPNPIMVIAGIQKNDEQEKTYPLLIIQERTKEPLPPDTDFKRLRNILYSLQDFTSLDAKLLYSMFSRGWKLEVKKYYNRLHAVYSCDEQKIKIRKNEDWKVLCERV